MARLIRVLSAALAMTAVSASAATLTVDGITFESGATFATGNVFENRVGAVGDTLSGYGEILEIYGPSGRTWLIGQDGYHLTYVFTGYVVSSFSSTHVDFTGGETRLYVQRESDPGYTALTPVQAALIAPEAVRRKGRPRPAGGVLDLDGAQALPCA